MFIATPNMYAANGFAAGLLVAQVAHETVRDGGGVIGGSSLSASSRAQAGYAGLVSVVVDLFSLRLLCLIILLVLLTGDASY